MKRHLLSFMLPLLALAACEKPLEEQEIPQSQTGESIEFTASMEEIGAGTKTSLGPDADILWQEGELILISPKQAEPRVYELKSGAGKKQGRFERYTLEPNLSDAIDHFLAIAPVYTNTGVKPFTKEGNVYVSDYIVMQDVQKYVQNSYDPVAFPMIAISDTSVLPFKNVAGILKLRIKGTSVVKNIILSTSKTITGKTKLTSDAVLTLTGEGGKKSILLDCGKAGVQLKETTPTAFHFVLPPVDLSDGFTVEIIDNANDHMVLKAPAGLKQNKIERNKILTMPEITYKAVSSAPVPSVNEIVVRMADPTKEPTGINADRSNKFDKVHIRDGYWKYVHKNGPLTEIPSQLFALRSINFEEMILPEGLETIMSSAFRDDDVNDDNYYLKKIVLPTTLKTIGDQAFMYCKALEEIVFNTPEKSQLATIGNDAFKKCLALRSVVLPNNPAVKSFVFGGFRECANLTSVNIPENTVEIQPSALQGTSLKTLTVPEGVKTIGANAFDGMTQLEKAVIHEGVTIIPESLFGSCANLTSLTLPRSVQKIDQSFIYGTKITSLDLPDGLEEIADRAFQGSQLTSFTIPSSVKKIGFLAIQSTAVPITVTVKAPDTVNLEGWNANFVSGCNKCYLRLHSSRKGEIDAGNNRKWKGLVWKSITFIDDSGNVVNP